MFWNKKETKSTLPDLPPLKSPIRPAFDIPSIEHDQDDEPSEPPHGLPAFPDSPMQRGFSQSAIKDAVSKPDVSDEPYEPDEIPQPQKIKTMEMDDWTTNQPPMSPLSQQLKVVDDSQAQQPMIPSMPIAPPQRERKGSDVFVKIEKFNSARRSLDSVKQKLDAIDVLLKKIRETKLREEQELAGWEKEIAAIKSRIQDIGSNVFD